MAHFVKGNVTSRVRHVSYERNRDRHHPQDSPCLLDNIDVSGGIVPSRENGNPSPTKGRFAKGRYCVYGEAGESKKFLSSRCQPSCLARIARVETSRREGGVDNEIRLRTELEGCDRMIVERYKAHGNKAATISPGNIPQELASS